MSDHGNLKSFKVILNPHGDAEIHGHVIILALNAMLQGHVWACKTLISIHPFACFNPNFHTFAWNKAHLSLLCSQPHFYHFFQTTPIFSMLTKINQNHLFVVKPTDFSCKPPFSVQVAACQVHPVPRPNRIRSQSSGEVLLLVKKRQILGRNDQETTRLPLNLLGVSNDFVSEECLMQLLQIKN